MNEHFLHSFTNLTNQYIDKVIVGNNSRKEIIDFFNIIFEEGFSSGKIDRLCKVNSCAGNKSFKNSLSSFTFRSGFELRILNDTNLTYYDIQILSSIILSNPYFVRKLMSLGYDTLVVKNTKNISLNIELKLFTTLNSKLLR